MSENQPSGAAVGWAVRDNAERKRFEIELGGGAVAIAEYTLPEGIIMFTHTEVPPEQEGKGIGTVLIEAGLAAARERSLKVIPSAPSSPPTCRSMKRCRTCWTMFGGGGWGCDAR